jgi:integrase
VAAERKLAELLHTSHTQTWVEPSTVTVGDWLHEWLEKAIKPPRRTLRAYETYKSAIIRHLVPKLGAIRLQELHALDIERYHAELGLAPATGEKHHAILNSALKAALRSGLLARNVAPLVTNRPRAPEGHDEVLAHVWEAHEAKQFLVTAKAAGPQPAAVYALALDTGMRKAELCGLRWTDLSATGTLTVQRQLVKPGSAPLFGPVKNKTPRQLELGPATRELLHAHKRHQATLKLRNRPHYHDHGLMFAKDWGDLQRGYDTLGDPLQVNNLGQREYAKLLTASGVRRIKFHGMRHTCATLLLQAGVPAHVVQKRLGHKRIEMTLSTYAHALPSMQQDAAARLGAILHG